MKYAREIKVAVLVIICSGLVFFGLNFLKGKNIFSRDCSYIGKFENLHGLQEQSPVYIRGYKVGQVERIEYDFSQDQAFTVTVSVSHDISLPITSEMYLIDDGLLGGKAIEIMIPTQTDKIDMLEAGATIPASVKPGLVQTLQEGLLAKLDDAVANADSLIVKINTQIDDQSIQRTLSNVESVSSSLVASAHDIKKVTSVQLPGIIENVDTLIADAKIVVNDVKNADLRSTLQQLNQTIDTVQHILSDKEGTLGLLLNDKGLYQHIDSTIVSVDSLVTDLKQHPKRYVHFSLFGGKDKSKKKNR